MFSRIAPAGALVLLSTIAGCAANVVTDEEASASAEALTSETFRLYSDDDPDRSEMCDIRTVLTLSSGSRGEVRDPFRGKVLHAHLVDEVVGYCKIYIDPAPREYTLLFDGGECGSRVYAGSTTVDGVVRELTLSDHRKRTCTDPVPAKLVVDEREEGGEVRTLRTLDKTGR